MKKFVYLIIICFVLIITGRSLSSQSSSFHTPPDKWKESRLFHSEFNNTYSDRILISHSESDVETAVEIQKDNIYSPNKAYWFRSNLPDTMKPGPWSTEILIFIEREYFIKIDIIDYAATYPITIEWINDKLLYVRFWLGKILGIDFIFDVEKEAIVYREMIYDGSLAFQQFQQYKQK